MRARTSPALFFVFLYFCLAMIFVPVLYAQDNSFSAQPSESVLNQLQAQEAGSMGQGVVLATSDAEVEAVKSMDTITLDFKEADIRDVLKIISYKSGVNIVASPEVTGTVNVRISDVPWERALDVILKTYGYAYDKQDRIIMVAPLEKLTAQRRMEQDLSQVQPTATEVVTLKYVDATDAKKAIEPQLSPRGRVTILEITGQAGWGFGGSFSEKRSRSGQTSSRSKTLIISDIPPVLEEIRKVLDNIDVRPKQILIETRLVEVNLNKLKDFGFDYATGGAGSASSETVTTEPITKDLDAGGHSLSDLVTPSIFSPQATAISSANTGLKFIFQKLSGTKFEVILHALEENVFTNTLSAPSILTLDNQEATILVGEQFPIITTTKSSDTSTTVDVSLEEYKDIGIQLNVVPQVNGKNKNYINMILHPAVTTEGTLIENKYPRITTREVQTQVLIQSGETIMIGGLIKDVKKESVQGVPFLRKIPFLGNLFERKTYDTEKIELLIFITANIVDDKSLTEEQLAELEKNLGLHNN
ncbi:MAG: secretin and TonB N-terminal domain-containing protein [Candidatus Omnitrophota bacterium]